MKFDGEDGFSMAMCFSMVKWRTDGGVQLRFSLTYGGRAKRLLFED